MNEYLKSLKDKIRKDCLTHLTDTDLLDVQQGGLRRKLPPLINNSFKSLRGESLSHNDRQWLIAEVAADIIGLGPIAKFIDDQNVNEIMINGHKQVYIECNGKIELTNITFRDERHVEFVAERVLSSIGRRVTESEPYIDARLPDGSRVNVVSGPVSLSGIILTIRRFSSRILTCEDLVRLQTINNEAAEFLMACVKAKMNIVICGGSGVGKTTMLNVLSNSIPKDERVITIEDIAELRLRGDHVLRLETRPPNIQGTGEITVRQLVKNALHMRPDRIIVGEVRGSEVLDMLRAMTTGHEGSMTTMHANSAIDAVDLLELMTIMDSPNISAGVARRQIINAVDLFIHMVRLPDGKRKVSQVLEMDKENKLDFKLRDIFSAANDEADDFKYRGNVPAVYAKLKKRLGYKCSLFEK